MNTFPAHLTRLMTFAQHGQPKEYAGSDMMRADLEVLALAAVQVQVKQQAPLVAWRRPWVDGDCSDVGAFMYATDESELDDHGVWQALSLCQPE